MDYIEFSRIQITLIATKQADRNRTVPHSRITLTANAAGSSPVGTGRAFAVEAIQMVTKTQRRLSASPERGFSCEFPSLGLVPAQNAGRTRSERNGAD